ncbi:MAG: carboxypeptidase regulatory-like domain-containing protein [Sedimentisphaerales bacterium]
MTAKTHPRGAICTGILCLTMFLEFAGFANGNNEPNTPLPSRPDAGQFKYTGVLCGHITDAKTGQPVTDATVIVERTDRAKTDANGYYYVNTTYTDRDCQIAVDSNDYVAITDYQSMPSLRIQKGTQTVKDFKLDKACMIQVQVVDEANQPIENTELSAASLTDEYRNKFSEIKRRTDKNGVAIFGGLPPSKTPYQIVANHYGVTDERSHQRQWDYAPGKLEALLNDTNVVESGRIVLQKGTDVYGNARYEDGVPASDLKIEASPNWWGYSSSPESYPIDANGNFTLRHVAPGIYRLMAYIPMVSGGSMGITISQTTLPPADNEPLKLTIPQKSPQSLVSIRGKLVFPGGKKAKFVNIEAYTSAGRDRFSHSYHWPNYKDPCDMNFVIDRLEPGKYRVTVTSSGMEDKIIEDFNAPSDGFIVELVPADKLHLKGTVLNYQTGQPIEQFKARAKKIKTLRGQNYMPPDQWSAFDNNEGRFEMEAPGPGIYQVQIAAEGFAWTWSKDINTDQDVPLVIKLGAGGSIVGKVVDEKGNPVSGAKVVPLSKAGGIKNTLPTYIKDPFESEEGAVETADGKFELKHLQAGRESIKVLHPDYAYSIVSDIEVKEDQPTEGIEVVLNKGATVGGYVFDNEGQPQSNVTLYFKNIYSSDEKSGRVAEVTTDINGHYQAECLPEKMLTVRRQKTWESMGVVCRTIVPANGKVSRIDLGGKPNVTGRLIIDGEPVTGRRVTLSSIGGANSDLFRCYSMTENDGSFTFGGIPRGKWTIYYDDTERRNNQIKVADFELTGQNANLGTIPKGVSTVSISIEYEQESPKWEIIKAYLKDDNNFFNQPVTEIAIPNDYNQPFTAKYVLPGEHYLVLVRKDYSSLSYPIKVTESSSSINIRLPKCTAGIHGRMTGKYLGGQTVWTKDRSVVSYIRPENNGDYQLDNLPAGQYLLGGNMLIKEGALLEFELKEGEQKTFDIDIPETLPHQMGGLQVIVIDENGALLTGAKAWLQNGASIVEPVADIGGFYFVTEPQKYELHAKFTGYKESKQQVKIENLDLKTTKRPPEPVFVRLEK